MRPCAGEGRGRGLRSSERDVVCICVPLLCVWRGRARARVPVCTRVYVRAFSFLPQNRYVDYETARGKDNRVCTADKLHPLLYLELRRVGR